MKLVVCAGPPSSGKTSVLKSVCGKLLQRENKIAYLKIDTQYAIEDEIFKKEFGIPTKKVYTGDLCPDHVNVLILGDGLNWAEKEGADVLLVESAGLCLRCAPYVEGGLGIVVLEVTSGMQLPLKLGPILSLADAAVMTKIDLISQAEKEVFRAGINKVAPNVCVLEADALHGIGISPLVKMIERCPEIVGELRLKGVPPLGVCTICIGKKEIGWEKHFGILRALEGDLFYRGE
ncbi:MAG: cobalamin biosynthesis protein [Methanophagales archaeon]|nr:cobalamin biosynthesis protein [Methanophagales archaeon]